MKSDSKNTHAAKIYENISIKKLPNSEIEITGTIPAAVLDSYRKEALKNINSSVSIDGFRKGNIPENVLIAKVGEKTILEEMAEIALSHAYPAIVVKEDLDPIGRPEIRITKMALGNPLEFIIKTGVTPEVTLPDYKKIAKETPVPDTSKEGGADLVSEKEIDEALARVKKAHMAEHEEHDRAHAGQGHAGQSHAEHDHSEYETPAFREKVKGALIENRKYEAIEKRRIAIADKIAEASKLEIPAVLLKSETARIEAQFKEDIARMGVNLEDYLKTAKKTIEDLRNEWGPHAEKKAKLQIIVNKIAELEKIKPLEKEIEAEVAHILEHYKDANKGRAHAYAAGVLTNEKVFVFLEGLK